MTELGREARDALGYWVTKNWQTAEMARLEGELAALRTQVADRIAAEQAAEQQITPVVNINNGWNSAGAAFSEMLDQVAKMHALRYPGEPEAIQAQRQQQWVDAADTPWVDPVVSGGRAAEGVLEGVRAMIRVLGDDPDREGLQGTPDRVLRWLVELAEEGDEPFEATTFEERHDDLVLVRAIPFRALCEHHMLPFWGTATIGYIPGGSVLGLSKLARIVRQRAARLTTQERLTREIARQMGISCISSSVAVVTVAEHSCMSLRGVKAHGSETITSSMRGEFRKDPALRAEFMGLSGLQG